MKRLLCLTMMTALSAHALETDNYLSWGVNLPDSGEEINSLIHQQIEEVLAETAEEDLSCEQVTFRIAHRFKTTPTRKLFEDWSTEQLTSKMFPLTPHHLHQSIYRHTSRLYMHKAGISPNLQTNGIYFGVDKLSHFGSTGRRYLRKYLKKIKQGYSAEEAEKSAIRFGLANEAGILGIWASGVFSYGDMEANYQGFLFYKKLCLDQKATYLSKEGASWKMVSVPDIKKYVSPYWDETFNLSYRAPGMWNVSSEVLKDEYCPLKDKQEIQDRMKYYQSFPHNSTSLAYIAELQASGYKKAPIPYENQSFDQLCAHQP